MAKTNRTREARERRQKQRQRNQQGYILLGIVAIVIVAFALIVVSSQPTEAPIPAGVDQVYAGLVRSESNEGYPRLGNPDAPVKVDEYSSFSCPHCAEFHEQTLPLIMERAQRGEVLFTFKPMLTGNIPNAEGAARTALCAGKQDKFWEMHEVLFDWHTRFGNSAFTQARLLAGVEELGLNTGSFNSCFNTNSISNTISSASSEGVAATPTIKINNVEVEWDNAAILAAIDAAIPSDWTPPEAPVFEDEEDIEETEEAPLDLEATEEASTSSEMTESEMGELTESDVEAQTSNDEVTESQGTGSSNNNELTESQLEESGSNTELTESQVEDSSGGNELTESEVEGSGGNELTESDVEATNTAANSGG